MGSKLMALENQIGDFSVLTQTGVELQSTILSYGMVLGVGVLALASLWTLTGTMLLSRKRG
jgi:hypothetical protein